jgi:DNA polymerase-3 subunit chi
MTRVTFYSNVVNKQQILFNLMQEALQKRHLITVLSENEVTASKICSALWEADKRSFIPNVIASHQHAAETPVVIDWRQKELSQDDILINLIQQQPTAFSRFRQLIEIVGNNEDDKVAARVRYKFYRDRGYEIKHIDALSVTSRAVV